tara:strand:+ start:252 stop:437 length:186 start_codon:yes stop_codon:yes gene_type:complete
MVDVFVVIYVLIHTCKTTAKVIWFMKNFNGQGFVANFVVLVIAGIQRFHFEDDRYIKPIWT